VPSLKKAGFLDSVAYRQKSQLDPWVPIMEVADFNSLIALSREHQVTVYALAPAIVGVGVVWEQAKASMAVFEQAFRQCAERGQDRPTALAPLAARAIAPREQHNSGGWICFSARFHPQ
jgi:hypothetical protein